MKTFHQQFIDFCERKPVNEAYDYHSSQECACAQFAKHLGILQEYQSSLFTPPGQVTKFYPLEVVASGYPHTWGELAYRAKQLL